MKKMVFNKTVMAVAVALAMSGVCTIPVVQAASNLENLQNLGAGSVWQAATTVYGEIMGDLSKAIADDININKSLDDLISLNQATIDIEVKQYQKQIDNAMTVLETGGLSEAQKVELSGAIYKLMEEQGAIQETGEKFADKINQYKTSVKNAAATGVKVLGHGFDIYEITKEFNAARKEIIETKSLSLSTIRDIGAAIASINPHASIVKYTLESAGKVVEAGEEVMETYRDALLSYSQILDTQRESLRETLQNPPLIQAG